VKRVICSGSYLRCRGEKKRLFRGGRDVGAIKVSGQKGGADLPRTAVPREENFAGDQVGKGISEGNSSPREDSLLGGSPRRGYCLTRSLEKNPSNNAINLIFLSL